MSEAQEERKRSEEIGGIKATLSHIKETLTKQNDSASAHRRLVYEKLDEITEKVSQLSSNDKMHDARLGKIEPAAADFSIWKQRFIGMAMIVTLFSSAVAASVTYLLKKWFLTP